MKKVAIIFYFILVEAYGFAQSTQTVEAYIQKYKDIAMELMRKDKIPASITLAQGILESGCGNSELARNANNHFGIKCKPEWMGEKYYYDDDAKQECFRKYKSDFDSYRDHSEFLKTRDYYSKLFLLDICDFTAWAYGLKEAGYATSPVYAQMLIKIIEDNRLYRFDAPCKPPKHDTVQRVVIKDNTKPISEKKDTIAKKAIPKTVQQSTEEDFSDIPLNDAMRKIYLNNGVKYIKARKNDSFETIANDMGLSVYELLRCNDMKMGIAIKAGDVIYVETKKKKSETEFHVVAEGETMQTISQTYGIQLKELYAKNRMKPDSEAAVGQKLWLKDDKPE